MAKTGSPLGRMGKRPAFKLKLGDRVQRALIAIAIYASVLVLVLSAVMPERYSLEAGDVAPVDIPATKDIVDTVATEKLKDQARSSVNTTYTRDHTIPVDIRNSIERFFDKVVDIREEEELSLQEKLDKLKKESRILLEDADLGTALSVDNVQLDALRQDVLDVTDQIMSGGVTPDALERTRREAEDFFSKQQVDQQVRQLGYSIADRVIKPNMLPSIEETNKDIEAAVSKVEPVIIRKGQNIVNRGDAVTRSQIELLNASGILKQGIIDYRLLAGYSMLILMLGILIALYIKNFHPRIYYNRSHLMLIGTVVVLILFISLGANIISGYLAPVAAVSMLITMLLDAKVGFMVNVPVAMLVALIADGSLTVLFLCIIGGLVGSLITMVSYQRRDLIASGLLVGGSNALVIICMGLITGSEVLPVIRESLWGILNGGFAAIFTIGTLPAWENLFGIITPLKLLELSNPNQPLLKTLLMEAPGTYHHSVIVGNLAEHAAQKIGANSLLARAGAYYHDIGKIKRPYFFTENQIAMDNPHEKITPSLSTLIITSHVKDGVEMAKQHKIPEVIIDIIKQHHGDSVVSYFYHKAKQGENSDKVTMDSFRYEGPRPQTKEAAIVMLADSVEAAVRSMQDHSPGKIEGMIRKILKEKLESEQLDESDLTLRDLDIIADAFLDILGGIFHQRVEYPDLEQEMKGGKKNDGADRKQAEQSSG
ncbi:MAG: HDIG domain-containing metalloprotein [Bacillota bacterium]|nr:HDIG domain-containing protein [Bacillota bacterium]MDD3850382.1 HDIG domain-containing protein [Bacillota bacterium]MDD4708009.1 HDIG domain-containing protein [Bacillota bacterium]